MSSSGTGIAVSTGMVLGGVGTDTGGSVRGPASFNGHSGLKVTFGRVPKWGCAPLGYTLDSIGPMARSAWDCAAILNVIAGYDARDFTASTEPVDDYLEGISAGISGLRVGVPTGYFFDRPELQDGPKEAAEAVIAKLVDLGAYAREVHLPHSDLAREANTVTMAERGAGLSPTRHGQRAMERVRLEHADEGRAGGALLRLGLCTGAAFPQLVRAGGLEGDGGGRRARHADRSGYRAAGLGNDRPNTIVHASPASRRHSAS